MFVANKDLAVLKPQNPTNANSVQSSRMTVPNHLKPIIETKVESMSKVGGQVHMVDGGTPIEAGSLQQCYKKLCKLSENEDLREMKERVFDNDEACKARDQWEESSTDVDSTTTETKKKALLVWWKSLPAGSKH
jgi:hypothetical protein